MGVQVGAKSVNNNGTPVIVFTNHAKAAIALFISMCQPHLQSSVLSKRGVVVFAAGPKKSSIRASTCIQSFRWIACPACPMSRQKASTKPQRKTWESRSAQEEVCSREPNARIKWNLNDVRPEKGEEHAPRSPTSARDGQAGLGFGMFRLRVATCT